MKWTPAPIVGGYAADAESRSSSSKDTVNWLPVRSERPNGRSDWTFRPVPGMGIFAYLGSSEADSAGPVRATRDVEGRTFAVAGNTVYSVNTLGTVSVISSGAIPGSGRVTIAHNQESGGNTVVFTEGTRGWTYNTEEAVFAEITDPGFPGFKICDFLDQYIVGISPDGGYAFHSELAAAGEYNALDRYTAEAAPDRLVSQVIDHGQWWLGGSRTIEVYTNTGAATGTFQRIPGSTIERGVAGTHCMAKMDNSIWWVGDDGSVYRANGYTPLRVSTHPVEQALALCDLSQAFLTTYEDRGHKVLYITCPDGKTFGFDVASQEWHRRKSYGMNRWRVDTLTKSNGRWLAGDFNSYKLFEVLWGVDTEAGEPLIAECVTGVLHGNGNRVQVHAVKVEVESGLDTTTPTTPDPPGGGA